MKKKILCIVLSTLAVLCAVIPGVFCGAEKYQNSKNDNRFTADLASIYAEYDVSLTDEQKSQPFGLRRIMVNNYNGNDYSACAVAVDEENGFAVLQYNTARQAEEAYQRMIDDSLNAEPDCVAYLDSAEKGQVFPQASNKMGTPSYISNYKMDYDDVIVAVIDTGVMLEHELLKDRFVSSGIDLSSDGYADAGYDRDMQGDVYGHATFVSGIIADNTPDSVKILPYKVIPFGSAATTASAMIGALNDAVSKGADVVNMSLGCEYAGNSFKTAVTNAVKKGVCVCCSAGNDGEEVANRYPTTTPGAITVSALSTAGIIATYSNYGDCIDFCAPGSKIRSSVPTADGSGYATNSGTSFSSPYIAALCADIKSVDVNMSKDDVYQVLCDFSVDYGTAGYDIYYGNGRPDISNITYSSDSYSYSIPQGELNIYKAEDYTADTQPWALFAGKIKQVNVDPSVNRIGDYAFYSMEKAQFNMADTYNDIGDYAFYGCSQISSFTFSKEVENIGVYAFENINPLTLYGYNNTEAERYCSSNSINFVSLGCNHNYIADIVEPTDTEEGYTVYTCSVCNDSYIGAYIEPKLIDSGQCGDSLTYSFYDSGKLIITGTGDMYDYIRNSAPWSSYADGIKYVVIGSSVGGINPFSFAGCSNLTYFRCEGNNYSVISSSLYSADGKTLISYAGGLTSSVYTMPDSVENISAWAFVNAPRISKVVPNSNFTVEGDIIYDLNGNIVMACPEFDKAEFSVHSDISIYDYAFILCPTLKEFRADSNNITFGKYCLGYYFDTSAHKTGTVIYGFSDTTAYAYANKYSMSFFTLDSGICGDNMTWKYDSASYTLTFSGSGDMYYYSSLEDIPWNVYLPTLKKVVIGDNISSVSNYSFYNASKLSSLTMPLSLSAAADDTTWYNCSNIKTLSLTYGTGYMDDYGYNENESLLYSYTPWYISRKSITSFSLDENVRYIGDYAFRNCIAIKSLTLNKCSRIGDFAFMSCSGLAQVVNYSKNTVFGEYALFSYKIQDNFKIYTFPVMSGYDDSTSKDYCENYSVSFASLGCGHTRGYAIGNDICPLCQDGTVIYNCKDCGEYMYEEYVTHTGDTGHYLKGTLGNLKGDILDNVQVYVDGVLSSTVNKKGGFICDNITCGQHSVEFKAHSVTVASATAVVDKSNICANIVIQYGDFDCNGYVNVKDYRLARVNGYDDANLINLGKIENPQEFTISEKYENQLLPRAVTFTNEADTEEDYRRNFVAFISVPKEFTVTECGFIYGKNMSNDMLYLDKVGTANNENFVVKSAVIEGNSDKKAILYGSKSMTGTVSARFYMKYTNGVKEYIYYSDVSSYTYGG